MNQIFGIQSISRRNFLRISSVGLMAAFGLPLAPRLHLNNILESFSQPSYSVELARTLFKSQQVLNPNQQGRVLNSSMDIFNIPSFSGTVVNKYWRDKILPITDVTIGTSEDSFNLIWYKVGDEGYVHSGEVQPVITQTNPVVSVIPEGGVPAEVTVPFTDAHWDPGENEPVSYRFYYGTTYWVMETIIDKAGNPWYGVRDDKWDYMFYVNASHLRLIPPQELQPISADIPTNQKRIEVHLPEQVLIAFEFDTPVFVARVATGAIFTNGDFSTPAGQYTTFHKRTSRHMARGNLAANGYDLPGVPWNSYITEEGIAIHGTYWHNNFGRPRSHGCINLTPQAAKWVYLWTVPTVPHNTEWLYEDYGTSVDVID